ncbi:MAG: YncE family protein [Acidobacteriota bacterium]
MHLLGNRLCRSGFGSQAGLARRAGLAGIASLSILMATAGCGDNYRPVVAAVNPVGPAGQLTKYAVAISIPTISGEQSLATIVDFSGDTLLATPNLVTNPNYFVVNVNGSQGYVTNLDGSLSTFSLSNPSTLLTSDIVFTSLPVESEPVSMSAFSPASGLSTIFIPQGGLDSIAAVNASTAALYDTVDIEAGGTNPFYVVGTTNAPRVYAISKNSPGTNGQVDSIETVSTTTLSDSAQIPVGIDPVYGVMTTNTDRAFIMNQGSGTVSVLNVPSNELDVDKPSITVGSNPVWADLNTVANELVVLNAGNGADISAAQDYQGAYNAATTYQQNQIVTYTVAGKTSYYMALNSGFSGSLPTDTANWEQLTAGSLSIINIPLCNATAQPTNPNCSPTNPEDGVGFGDVIATVPVGIGASQVAVLQGFEGNNPAAYVVNQLDSTGTCGAGQGSVTVIDLQTNTVTTTICGISGSAATLLANGTANYIFGHPNAIAATGGLPTGKVYVTSSDNQYMSIIYTDTNTVQTHISLQGNGIPYGVMVTAK